LGTDLIRRFLVVAVDIVSHRQKMMVMNFVWPVTAHYFGPFALLTYFGFEVR